MFAVTATVLKTCAVTTLDLEFSDYDFTSESAVGGSTTLSVLCTTGTSFQVGLNAGSTSGSTVTSRAMTDGSNTLDYGLYQDASFTTNWGNTPGTDTPAAVVAGTTASDLAIYGRVPAGQNVPAGDYSDTIQVTVTY
jgi:spore coat protein U-like protein